MIDLSGRTALVTGAGGGIGLGIAAALASVGARVAINDINAAAATNAAAQVGSGAFPVGGDVTNEAEVKAMVAAAEDTAGQVDILVNNAGIAEPMGSIRSQRVEDWQRVIDVNLRGAYLMSQAAARVMIPRRGGAIVNIVSIAGIAPFPSSHAYGVSKAGLVMLTQTLAIELARHHIRVNAVAPGVIDAPMLGEMNGDAERMPRILARVPLGRLGAPADIGRAVCFLASEAADYVTGAVLPVDGGWLAYGGVGPASQPKHVE